MGYRRAITASEVGKKLSDKQGIQVIARAAQVLRALETEPDGLSLGELSVRVGLARSTVQRIVGALIEEQMLIAAGPRAGVMLGPTLARLASAANIEIDRIVRPVMQRLALACGETVNLSILHGRAAMFVDQVLGTAALIAVSAPGETHPLHSTAKGKALLACVDPARRRALLAGELVRFTDATITDIAEIEQQLETFAETQLVYDLEEHGEGICAIGTSFIDPLNRSFALSVPMPTSRFKRNKGTVDRHLLSARDQILKLVPGASLPSGVVT